MEISPQALAGFVYGVAPEAVLSAAFRPDGGLAAVIDRGILGAPKCYLGAQATAQAKTEYTERESTRAESERRGTFTSTPLPRAAAKSKRARATYKGA